MTMCLMASVLSGCGRGDSAASEPEHKAGQNAEQAQTDADEGATDGEDPYVCKIVCVGDATTEACEAVAEAASEITMEKFGTRIELVRFGYGTFVEEVNLMLSSGEKLDLYPSFGYNTMTAANTGQILDLTDLLEEYGQGIRSQVTEGEWSCVTFDGKIYSVPNNKEKAQGFGMASAQKRWIMIWIPLRRKRIWKVCLRRLRKLIRKPIRLCQITGRWDTI